MAMGPNGTIYITGYCEGGNARAAAVGYNADGGLIWETRDPYPFIPVALAVDAGGNVCVTGYGTDNMDFDEIQTVKYDSSKNLLWAMHDDGGRMGSDAPIGIAFASSGDVLVCGNSEGSSTGNDFYAAMYRSNDNGPHVQWRQTYNGPSNDDIFRAMALDPDGNVFVTGSSYGDGTFSDYATVKYAGSGQPAWPAAARYDKSGYEDYPYSMAAVTVDASRYVFVSGQSYESTDAGWRSEIATVKYDSNSGGQQAETRHSGTCSSSSQALAADATGNVYVVGRIAVSGQSGNFLTVKYNSSLVQQWEQAYDGPVHGNDRAVAVTVDSMGNVYVTGISVGSGTGNDITTVKYDSNGNQLWVAPYDGPDRLGDQPVAIKTDSQGNVYVLGSSQGSTSSTDFVTIKYSSGGAQIWAVRYNGPSNGADTPYGLAVDASGNVYVAGGSIGSSTYEDYVTIKYDTTGTLVWAARYNSNYSLHDAAQALAVDSGGNVYVTGRSQGISGHSDFATVKYDSAGKLVWVIRYNGPGDSSNYGLAITVDSNGYVYVAGQSEGANSNGMDYAVIKYKQK